MKTSLSTMVVQAANSRRILVLASTYPRFPGDYEPVFVARLGEEISREYEVDVLVPHAPGLKRNECQHSINIYRFRYALERMQRLAYDGGILMNLKRRKWTWLLVPFFFIAQLIAAAKLLRARPYAVIHAHWIIPQGLVAVIFNLLFRENIPILLTSHGGDLFGLRSKPLKWIKHWVVRRSAHLTVVSEAMRAYCVEELGIDAQMVTVRSMGVDLVNTFTPPESPSQRRGMVFVGRLVEKKGVEYLVRALSLIVKADPEAILTIVGDGPLKHDLKTLANSLGVSRHVSFVGGIPNDRIPEILRQHQIAVVPSIVASSGDQEGLGLVAVEALGCECAVVASDLPAIRDVIIDGKTGLLVRPADPESLAESIMALLADPAYAGKLARNGRQSVLAKFDWRMVGDDYTKIVRGIINQGKPQK